MNGRGPVALARALGETRAEERRREIAAEAEAIGGVSATLEDGNVVLEGRGLLDRWIRDASLRNIGRMSL